MRKKIIACLLIISSVSIMGCTKKEESFEDKVARKFTSVDAEANRLKAQVEELTSQVDILKSKVGVSTKPIFTTEELKFSSVKVLAESPESQNGEIRLPAKSTFDLNVDIMNTTKENLSQLICQAYVTYNLNGEYYDRYLLDTRFDVQPQNIRRKIEFKDIPVKDSKYEHILTIIIKDNQGNEVNRFEKKIFVK